MHNQLLEFVPFLSALLRSGQHAVLFVDHELKIVFCSKYGAALLEAEESQLQGRTVFDLLSPEGLSSDELLQRRSWSGSMRFSRASGEIASVPVAMTRTAPSGGTPPGILLELLPNAEVDSANGGHTKRTRSIHQRSQLESLGVLSSGIAHDLNNILAGILGHVSFLKLSLPLDGSDLESLQTIEQGTRRAAQLTKQVLEFARGQELDTAPVALSDVVRDVVQLIKTSVPEGVALETRGLETPLQVTGDEAQLNQLILNLAINARDAVGATGTIQIEVAERNYSDVESCKDLGIEPGSYVLLSVRDTGPGIEESIRSKIFEPFFTTKEENGTGLGLATVQTIVQAHHGLLVVDCAAGQGTCFEIALPKAVAQSDAHRKTTTTRTNATAPTNRTKVTADIAAETILIVDDEAAVRMIMEKSLQHLGYTVHAATNGQEALELFTNHSCQLVILDMIMPGMAGDEVFAKIREQNPEAAVLIASGYASDGRIRALLKQGALGYIQKPFSVEELAEEVQSCLRRHQTQSQQSDAITEAA